MSTSLTHIPRNLRMTAIMADAEHVVDVATMVTTIQDEQALSLIGAWRRDLDRFPFLVLAGGLHRRVGGIVGGLAAQWEHAVALQHLAIERLDELARSGVGFTSMWVLLLTDARRECVEALIAQLQPVEGSA